jgi:hypothetical protein
MEIAVTAVDGEIFLFNSTDNNLDGRADIVPGYPVRNNNAVSTAPIAVDFLNNDREELLVFDDVGSVYLIDGTGYDSLVYDVGGFVHSAAAYNDDQNNIIDIAYTANNELHLARLSSDLNSIDFSQVFSAGLSEGSNANIISADINRDDDIEILISYSTRLALVNSDGEIMWNIRFESDTGKIAVGDINSDGYPEIIITESARIHALNHLGILLSNYPVDFGFYDMISPINGGATIGDVDGDSYPDIIVGLPDGSVYALDHNGDWISGFPLPSSFGIERSSILTNLDSDNDIDMITIESSGFIKAWDISSVYANIDVPWAMAGGGSKNKNYLDPDFNKQLIAGDVQLPENSVYNYPNPARNSTTIRYYLNSDSRVKIDIFDFMGERIHEADLDGIAHMDNEYVWDCSGIASGVYFCRVEADNGTEKKYQIIKIALTN